MTLLTKGMGAIIKTLSKSKKVSPTIKSVKPTKLSVKESLKKTRGDEYHNGEGERSELCYRDGNIFREVDDHSFFVDVYSDDLTCVIPTPKEED